MKNNFFIYLLVILSAIVVGSSVPATSFNQPDVGAITPTLPNEVLTPGKADTLLLSDLIRKYNGKTYSQAHRNVSKTTHDKVYDEYHVPQSKRNGIDGEVDHLVPLCAGGSNSLSNLWYQPAPWYHLKDKLEVYICTQIKAGKLDPKVAYKKITTNWYSYYQELDLNE